MKWSVHWISTDAWTISGLERVSALRKRAISYLNCLEMSNMLNSKCMHDAQFFFRNSSFFAFTYVYVLDSFSHFALATYSQWCNECLQLFGNFFSSLFCVLFSYFKSNIEKKHNILTVHSHPRGIERINAIPITRKLKRIPIYTVHAHAQCT